MNEDLNNDNSIEKLKSIVSDIKIAIFCTELSKTPIQSRPMSVREVDDQGNLWFISSTSSNKNFEIEHDNQVQLFFSNVGASQYLSLYGVATIYKDQQKIDDLWTPIAKAWFEEGIDDIHVSVIKVTPSDVYYWDTKDNKIVTLLKLASAAIFGTQPDIGVEGKLII